ncbi:MAG: hypothetical protein WCI47_01810 [bacterium]
MSFKSNTDNTQSNESYRVELLDPNNLSKDIFFNLSLSPKNLPVLDIVAGDIGKLQQVQYLFEFMKTWHWPGNFFTTQRSVNFFPPGSITSLVDKKSGVVKPDVFQGDCKLLGFGIHLGSQEQMIIEGLMGFHSEPTLITAELLPVLIQRPELRNMSHIIPLLAVADYIRLVNKLKHPVKLSSGRGIYNVAELLDAVPLSSELLLAYDNQRLYSYIRADKTLIHAPRNSEVSDDVIQANLALLTMAVRHNRHQTGSDLDVARAILFLAQQSLIGFVSAENVAKLVVQAVDRAGQ